MQLSLCGCNSGMKRVCFYGLGIGMIEGEDGAKEREKEGELMGG